MQRKTIVTLFSVLSFFGATGVQAQQYASYGGTGYSGSNYGRYSSGPALDSRTYAIFNQRTGRMLASSGETQRVPIASITKLMTAMVVLDARQRLSEFLVINNDDIDYLKGSSSRLSVGTRMSREEMLRLALMSSENRASSALARHYPGGRSAFIQAMNIKARMIGMSNTRFVDSTGLSPSNVASAGDLVKLVQAASAYPLIREFSTTPERYVSTPRGVLRYTNSNGLVREGSWAIGVSKTGYIREAGRCLVMQTWIGSEPVIMVMTGASGSGARTNDAYRMRQWAMNSGGLQGGPMVARGPATPLADLPPSGLPPMELDSGVAAGGSLNTDSLFSGANN